MLMVWWTAGSKTTASQQNLCRSPCRRRTAFRIFLVVVVACFALQTLCFVLKLDRIIFPEPELNAGSSIDDPPPILDVDEFVDGQPASSFYRKLVDSYNADNPKVDSRVFAAYEYDDHIAVTVAEVHRLGTEFYCVYLDDQKNLLGPPEKSFIYPRFVVHCPRRVGAIYVTVTRQLDVVFAFPVRPMNRTSRQPEHFLTYCLAPIYGSEPKWMHLVEMLEHYRLQGVSWSQIYVKELDAYSMRLLTQYAMRREVEIVEVPRDLTSDVILQQLFAVSDCLQRNKNFAKWTIFADLDERLLMTDETTTIHSFLSQLTNTSIGSVLFPQRWIMKTQPLPNEFKGRDQLLREMPTLRYTNTSSAGRRSHPACQKSTCWAKLAVDPSKVVSLMVHDVEAYYPGFGQLALEPDVAYIRHYRDVQMQDWVVKNAEILLSFGPFSETNYPPGLMKKLKRNVLKQLQEVYGSS